MYPRGHVSCHATPDAPCRRELGTETHGPATGTHTCSPSHSFALPAGDAATSATESVAASNAMRMPRVTEPS